MVYSLTYRRPSHVTSSGDSIHGDQKPESFTSGSSGVSAGIPDALSFDNIINNGTCPVSHLKMKELSELVLINAISLVPFATS